VCFCKQCNCSFRKTNKNILCMEFIDNVGLSSKQNSWNCRINSLNKQFKKRFVFFLFKICLRCIKQPSLQFVWCLVNHHQEGYRRRAFTACFWKSKNHRLLQNLFLFFVLFIFFLLFFFFFFFSFLYKQGAVLGFCKKEKYIYAIFALVVIQFVF